jgi:cytochrome c
MNRLKFLLSVLFFSMANQGIAQDDFFAGKWKTLVVGTPQGDAKMILELERVDGDLTGTITPDVEGAQAAILDKVEENENSVNVFFSMMGYDLNLELTKKDENNLSGNLMGMFDATSERVIEESDFYAGDWNMIIFGTPQGDAKMLLQFERENEDLTGYVTPADGSTEPVKIDTIEETEESVTIYFSMMGYDLNIKLDKVDEKSMKGNLMGMFDVTAEKK